MTPRNPWRRTWRETVAPLLWLVVVSVLIGSALGLYIAHAEPASAMAVEKAFAPELQLRGEVQEIKSQGRR